MAKAGDVMDAWFFSSAVGCLLLLLLTLNEALLKCYVAARSEKGVLRMMIILHRLGFGIISDILGESVSTPAAARKNTARIILHARRMAKLRQEYSTMRLAIAVKPSMIGLSIDKQLARRNLRKIYRTLLEYSVRLEIDMEGGETINDTIDLTRSLIRYPYGPHTLRQAIPANQQESRRAISICGNLGISVREIKGAYPGDIEGLAAINESYVELTAVAMEYGLDIAYATHDLALLKKVQEIYQGTVQKLFGIRMFDMPADDIYMPWGGLFDAWRFLLRRVREGVRPNVFTMFLRNVPESLYWRLRYAPLTFFQ